MFHYAPTREHRHVEACLGDFRGTLLSDGHEAYGSYAKRHGAVHAQCWSHGRRMFEQAQESAPETVASALALIGGLYGIERDIRRARLAGVAKRTARESQSAPLAREFFAWCGKQCERGDLPKSPLAKALRYALDREAGLSVFLCDPCAWRSTRTTWSAACGPSRPGAATGCSRGRNWARSASA